MAALVWNSLRYPIRRGFDSGAHRRYAEYIFDHGRLPGFEDTYVAYNPPLFYLCAAAIRFANEHIPFGPSLNTPDKATRVLMAILTCLWLALSVRLCGEILGERTKTPYLLFLGAMPGFFKISAMFTPEILLTALIWIGLGLLMRSWGRDGKISRRAALLYGLFLFLAAWTRPFGVAPLAAMSLSFPYFILRDRVNWRNWVVPAAIILGIGGAGMLSSLEFNQLRFGKSMPLPYDQQPLRRLPPLSFYFGIDPGAMLTRPVRPSFGQTSIPVFYSDLWGDYWRYWILADAERPSNRDHKSAKGTGFSKLDRRWIPLLGVQNLLALYPTLLMSGGLLMLIVRAFRSRMEDPFVRVVPLFFLLLFGSAFFLYFVSIAQNPDSKQVKVSYISFLLPILAMGGAYSLDMLQRARYRSWAWNALYCSMFWFWSFLIFCVYWPR